MCLFFAGCEERPQNPVERANIRLVVIGKARSDPTWSIIQTVCRQFSDRKGRVIAVADAPEAPSPSKQADLLVGLPRRQTDAVCIHPDDPALVAPAIDRLVRAGIPVITFGRDASHSNRMGYCGPAESEMGKSVAGLCGKLIVERPGSLMLLYAEGDDVTSTRMAGFRQEFPLQRGLKVLREIDCKANRVDAAALIKSESHRYPRAAGWVYIDDWLLRVTQPTERLVPLTGKVILCSAEVCHWSALRDGRIDAMLGFDYPKSLREALHAAVRFVKNATQGFANETHVPVEDVTLDNLPKWESRWLEWISGEPASQPARQPPPPALPHPTVTTRPGPNAPD